MAEVTHLRCLAMSFRCRTFRSFFVFFFLVRTGKSDFHWSITVACTHTHAHNTYIQQRQDRDRPICPLELRETNFCTKLRQRMKVLLRRMPRMCAATTWRLRYNIESDQFKGERDRQISSTIKHTLIALVSARLWFWIWCDAVLCALCMCVACMDSTATHCLTALHSAFRIAYTYREMYNTESGQDKSVLKHCGQFYRKTIHIIRSRCRRMYVHDAEMDQR